VRWAEGRGHQLAPVFSHSRAWDVLDAMGLADVTVRCVHEIAPILTLNRGHRRVNDVVVSVASCFIDTYAGDCRVLD